MATTSLSTSNQLDWSGNALLVTDIVASGSVYANGQPLSAVAPTNVTAATLAVAADSHAGKTVTLNKADGMTVTMPAATGSGNVYTFFLGTTSTSNAYVFSLTGDDTVKGVAILGDSTDGTAHIWATAAGNNTITLGGTSNATGGVEGTFVIFQDVAADVWGVRIFGDAGGTEATPFSTV